MMMMMMMMIGGSYKGGGGHLMPPSPSSSSLLTGPWGFLYELCSLSLDPKPLNPEPCRADDPGPGLPKPYLLPEAQVRERALHSIVYHKRREIGEGGVPCMHACMHVSLPPSNFHTSP